jgi:lipoprotein-anchoring transpeptidase ErfK/SrfK
MFENHRSWTVAAGKQFFVRLVIYTTALLGIATSSAWANVLISVNKNTQQMSVSVDGAPHYEFAVSTGRAGYGTPNGTYRPLRMAKTWFSKEYYNSPMPHSIFFHRGYAIHGSYEINRLGGPASHGCIRLHPENAETLFALVQREGMLATKIVVYGNNPAITQRRFPLAQPSYNSEPPAQPAPRVLPPFQRPFNTFDPGRVY